MSKVTQLIFNGEKHYISSPYGPRDKISTSAGETGDFHYGTDYATYNKKIPQYAIEDGTILSCGKDSAANGYALFVWVYYPRIGKKFLHYHLDSISVQAGQKVVKGTKLGNTGMTGKATGIHLHLGVKDIKTDMYENPETFAATYVASDSFLPARGYFKKGDSGKKIANISSFMRRVFPAYTSKKATGDIFGPYLESAIKTFQKAVKLEPDGYIGPLTLAELKKYGFTEN